MTVLFWVIAMASFATVAFLTYGVLSYCNSRKMVRDRFKQVPHRFDAVSFPGRRQWL